MSKFGNLPRQPIVIAIMVVLVIGGFLTFRPTGEVLTATAHFDRTVSLFEGSEVRILGVTVGTVTAVVPEGNSVRVDMEYDAAYDVPADAKAVIITPTLVADRFVQLTPAYDGGPTMRDGADIGLADTGSPVELDRIYSSLQDLSNALGPNGVNADGSLDTLLAAGTKALKGQGAAGNKMFLELSKAVTTLGDGSGELFATVRELELFITTLAQNDRFVSRFITDLASVSDQLSGEREELRAMLANLAVAVGKVESFVRDNKDIVEADVAALGDVVGTIARQKRALGTILDVGPLGANNLALAYDNRTATIGSRVQVTPNFDDIDGFLCSVIQNAELPDMESDTACDILEAVLEGDGEIPLPELPGIDPLPESGSGLGGGLSTGPATSLQGLLGGGR
jgi:phospholipid/cholesterol/gamma-HCH transport system substrate-binding protein